MLGLQAITTLKSCYAFLRKKEKRKFEECKTKTRIQNTLRSSGPWASRLEFPSLVTPWATTLDPVPSSLTYSCTNVSRDLRLRAPWQSHFLPCLSISSVDTQGQETQQAKGLKSAANQWPAVAPTLPLRLMVVEGSRIFEDNQQDLVVRPLTCLPLPPSILLPLFLPSSLLSFLPASKLSLRNQTMSPCLSGPHLLSRWALLPKDVRGTCEPMFFLISVIQSQSDAYSEIGFELWLGSSVSGDTL